jgi:uncharacterized protein (DUF362 family)
MTTRIACIVSKDLGEALRLALHVTGETAAAALRGARVLIKPNFNSPHPSPATTASDLIEALVDLVKAAGASHIAVGDSCGLRWGPADAVHRRLGVPELARRLGVEYVNFDVGPWRTVPVAGRGLKEVAIAEAAFKADRIVYAACMKTHRRARFSLSLKHAAGFLSPEFRHRLHEGDLESNIADINLAIRPDLVFVDGRRCFVAGGPARGWARRPGVILAGADRVALDVEALKILSSYIAWNRLLRDPWQHSQIRHAVALGLGAASEREYERVGG